jgi:hypothetical protein
MEKSIKKHRYHYLLKVGLLVSTLFLSLSSCEYDTNDLNESQATAANQMPFETKAMTLKDVPEVANYIKSIIGDISQKGKTKKSNTISLDATFEVEKILETIDTLNNKNYNLRFTFKDTPEHITYNLIVNFLPNGEKHAFVEKHTCNPEHYLAFRNSKYDIINFKGKVELFYYTSFFGQPKTDSNAKTSTYPCIPQYYPNGDPIPSVSSFVDGGSPITSSGGSSPSGGFSSSYGSAAWSATSGYGLSVQTTGDSSSNSTGTGTNTGTGVGTAIGGFITSTGTAIGDALYNTWRWIRSFVCNSCSPTQKTTADPCPTIVPAGFATFISEPERLAIIRSQIPLTLEQWQFLHGQERFMQSIIGYLSKIQSDNTEAKNFLSWTISYRMKNTSDNLPNTIINLLNTNKVSLENIKELLDMANFEDSYAENNKSLEAKTSLNIVLILLQSDNIFNVDTPAVDALIQNELIKFDPELGTAGFMLRYNVHVLQEMVIIMTSEYPPGHVFTPWEYTKIYFKASSETLHLGMDIMGMAPVVGPIFDVTHAAWYAFSGDYKNSALSITAVVPFVGDWTTVARISQKVFKINNGANKVILKAYKLADGFIKFSNRSQLRKLLGISSLAIHAHHVIPYGLANHKLVQLAAKYSSKTKSAWHINDIPNGIAMPADYHLNEHKKYSDKIFARLEKLYNDSQGNMEIAYDLLTEYTTTVKNTIEANPNLTLGEIADLIP